METDILSSGRLSAIALRPARKAPLLLQNSAEIGPDGLIGDHAGKFPDRQVTLLRAEDWAAACADLSPPVDPLTELPWTTRRANLLVEGINIPNARGSIIAVGEAELEVTKQTYPCRRMEEAHSGLLKTLAKDWRGGVLCKVLKTGHISVGDKVRLLAAGEVIERRLP